MWKDLERELDTGSSVNLPPAATPVKVSEVSSRAGRVRVVGKVVELGEDRLLLDDGTGSVRVLFEDLSRVEDLETGVTVRVFGSPLSLEEGFELHAEIVQRLDELDLDLYREVREETKKFEDIVKSDRRENL